MRPLRVLATPALAAIAAGSLVLMSAAPGTAARPLAQGDAVGLVLTIASTPVDSGAFSSTVTGDGEKVTGEKNPLITALGNQSVIQAGTVAQSAHSTVDSDGYGHTAACAGVAGDGATLISVDEANCLKPANNLTLDAGSLDLANLQLVQSDILGGLDTALQNLLQPILTPVLGAVDTALGAVLGALGNPGVYLDLGAIQSRCTAGPEGADGGANLAGASLYIQIPGGQKITLVKLPVTPDPNTKLLTDLHVVVDAVTAALTTQLEDGLGGLLAPLGPVANQILTTINHSVIDAIDDQLAPLEDNILDVTLNKQTRGNKSIDVTALDLHLLPVTSGFGLDLLSLEVGHVTCTADGRLAPPTDTPTDTPTNPNTNTHTPTVPTKIPSGVSDAGMRDSSGALNNAIAAGAVAALLALSGLGGVAAYRRRLTH